MMLSDSFADSNLASRRLQFMWQVGLNDVFDGMYTADQVGALFALMHCKCEGVYCLHTRAAAVAISQIQHHTTSTI